jgi:TRAP-type C4-dicarboxylate transport system substrate-binding protein
MKKLVAVVAVSVFALAPFTAGAEEIVLKFATTNAPTSRLVSTNLKPYAQRITDDGKGVLRIETYDGQSIANQANHLDRTLSDVIQIGWGLQSTFGGKFPRSDAGALPFVSDDSESASVAFWRVYKRGLLDAEYSDIHPLILSYLTQAGMHLRKAIKSPDDVAGLKLVASGWSTGQAIQKLGAAPLTIPLNEMYEAIGRGTADGATVSWTSFNPFKLAEVTSYHIEAALGTAPAFIYMAKKKFESLPADARAVLDRHTGEAEARRFGAWWDGEKNAGRADVIARKDPNRQIVELTPAQAQSWKQKTSSIQEEWAKNVPDGAKVLAAYKEELTKVKAGK